MNIQVVDKKRLIFRIRNVEYHFVKPNFLYKDFGVLIKATVKASTMGWNIEGEFLSYNKMKKLLTCV